MIRSAAYPASQRRARRYPRSGRRGLTALTAVLLLAGLLSAAMMNWQIAVANERIRGQARHLAEVVAAEGYGLHHWLHEVRECENGEIQDQAHPVCSAINASYSFDRPDPEDADELSDDEHTGLAAHSAIAGWRRSSTNRTRVLLPRGWEIVHLVGHTTGADLPEGILVLRPDNDIVNRPTWGAIDRALDVVLGSGTGTAAADLASAALTNFDATRDRAYFASRFARLDTNAVLRQPHAGHPALPMETNLNLGGNALENVNALRAQTGQIPEITGACADGTLDTPCADGTVPLIRLIRATDLTASAGVTVNNGDATLGTLRATDMTIMGDVTGINWIRTGDVTVSGTVTTPVLIACVNTEDNLCEGGDLQSDNLTVTTTTTTAATGIFGEITNEVNPDDENPAAPGLTVGDLRVRDCFRSVTPFVHGARCPE